MGDGEPLLAGLNLPRLGYEVARAEASDQAWHVTIEKSAI